MYENKTDCIGSGSLSSSYIQLQPEAAAGLDAEIHIIAAISGQSLRPSA
ncbi:hypothetical protein ACPPVU_11860 [Mucilaginibacter sp. McL0603]